MGHICITDHGTREVKMAGYSSFFECLWTDKKSRSIKTRGQYPAILKEQALSITIYFIMAKKETFWARFRTSGRNSQLVPRSKFKCFM